MPSGNRIAADPEAIRDGGRHFDGELATQVGQIRARLSAAIAANAQPDAYDDEAGAAFVKVYGPAEKDVLTLLESLETAFQQAYELIDGTAGNLAKVEEFNTVSAQAVAAAAARGGR